VAPGETFPRHPEERRRTRKRENSMNDVVGATQAAIEILAARKQRSSTVANKILWSAVCHLERSLRTYLTGRE
jgi:hypothetical protein